MNSGSSNPKLPERTSDPVSGTSDPAPLERDAITASGVAEPEAQLRDPISGAGQNDEREARPAFPVVFTGGEDSVRIVGLPLASGLAPDSYLAIDHLDHGTQRLSGDQLIRDVLSGGGAVAGVAVRGITVALNFVSGPLDNYAIAAHGLGSTSVQVTLTSNNTVVLAPWQALDENRVEVHVSHDFTGPVSAFISALVST